MKKNREWMFWLGLILSVITLVSPIAFQPDFMKTRPLLYPLAGVMALLMPYLWGVATLSYRNRHAQQPPASPLPPTPSAVDHHTTGDFYTVDEPPETKHPPFNCPCPNCDTGGAVLTDAGTYLCLNCGNSFHFSSSLT